MDALGKGVKELLPQKIYHKNNLGWTDTIEITYCNDATRKN